MTEQAPPYRDHGLANGETLRGLASCETLRGRAVVAIGMLLLLTGVACAALGPAELVCF